MRKQTVSEQITIMCIITAISLTSIQVNNKRKHFILSIKGRNKMVLKWTNLSFGEIVINFISYDLVDSFVVLGVTF